MKKILLVAAFLGSLGLNVQAQNVEPNHLNGTGSVQLAAHTVH